MEKVVYFLGAGFSRSLGLPLMSDFLIKSKDMYSLHKDKYDHFGDVFMTIDNLHKIKSFCKADLWNIEEILSILEMNQRLSTISNSQDFQRYIVDVIHYYSPRIQIERIPNSGTWKQRIFGNPESDFDYQHLYAFFVGNLLNLKIEPQKHPPTHPFSFEQNADASFSYSVISLNYDTILEGVCKSLFEENYHKIVGFSRTPNQGNNASGLNETPLVKLHGSVDAGDIIPPTWSKPLEPSNTSAWERAHRLVSEANYVRVLGYSLPATDSYIKYFLKSCFISELNLKKIDVLCYDPDGSVKERYDDFVDFNFYDFHNGKVEDYLKTIYRTFNGFKDTQGALLCDGIETGHAKFIAEK